MRVPLIVLFLCFCHAAGAGEHACRQPGATGALGAHIAAAALREHREFNGHRIDADGYLVRFGSVESETEPLLDAQTGRPAVVPGRFAWRRVWEYWTTLNGHADGETAGRKILAVPGLLDDPHTGGPAREFPLGALLPMLEADRGDAGAALREATVRAALNDSPWSAAFISYLMHRAGLSDAQFRYSSTHSDYIKAAFEAPDGYAYRACDARRTTPRIGDLLCYGRGARPLTTFAAWREAARAPGFVTASHCDVVVGVDLAARKFDTVGGNVLQSVTRRTLKLNQDGLLSASHRADPDAAARAAACLLRTACRRQDFNRQHWSVLLQLR